LTNRFQLSKKSAIIATTTLDGVEVSGGEIYIHICSGQIYYKYSILVYAEAKMPAQRTTKYRVLN
jgi:hypothetical protein